MTTAQQRNEDSIRPVASRPEAGPKGKAEGRQEKKQLVSGSSDEKIKLQRAQGGCPGTIRRRRTWQAAKSNGEPQAGTDPLISEWGNPAVEEAVTLR